MCNGKVAVLQPDLVRPKQPPSQSEIVLIQALGYGAVYFAQKSDGDCKVGASIDPGRRLKLLRQSHSRNIDFAEIIFTKSRLPVVDRRHAENIRVMTSERSEIEQHQEAMRIFNRDCLDYFVFESSLHQLYKDLGLHIHGEWFSGGAAKLIYEARRLLQREFSHCDYLDYRSMKRKLKALKTEAALAS